MYIGRTALISGEKCGLDHRRHRHRSSLGLPAIRAAIRAGAVLADRRRLVDDLHLLNDAVLAGQPLEPASAVRTTIQFIIGLPAPALSS